MPDLGRFAPGLELAVLFGLAGGVLWARVARQRLLVGIAAAMSLGVILALTLARAGPIPDGGAVGIGQCDVRQWTPGRLDELLVIGEASLNVALFIPLGVSIAFHRPPARRGIVLLFAAALPFLIELAQLKLPALGRYCDSMDIADNELGLLLGFAVAAIVLGVTRRLVSWARGESAAAVA